MIKKQKLAYEAPITDVLELCVESLVCQSPIFGITGFEDDEDGELTAE